MTRKPAPLALPDLDDDEFARRLKPLEAAMLSQASRVPAQDPVNLPGRPAGLPDHPSVGDTMERMAPTAVLRQPEMPAGDEIGGAPVATLRSPDHRTPGRLINRTSVEPDHHNTISTVIRSDGYPDIPIKQTSKPQQQHRREGLVGAAEYLAHIEQTRGPKRRFEYLIPARVGDALAADAARRGQSATQRLLEILRDAGYPVIPEDLIDLRKERRR